MSTFHIISCCRGRDHTEKRTRIKCKQVRRRSRCHDKRHMDRRTWLSINYCKMPNAKCMSLEKSAIDYTKTGISKFLTRIISHTTLSYSTYTWEKVCKIEFLGGGQVMSQFTYLNLAPPQLGSSTALRKVGSKSSHCGRERVKRVHNGILKRLHMHL